MSVLRNFTINKTWDGEALPVKDQIALELSVNADGGVSGRGRQLMAGRS